MHASGDPVGRIARVLGVSRDRVSRLLDPTYAAKRAAQVKARRAIHGRPIDRARRPEISEGEGTIVKERGDGSRISLPRVRWLERPMPEGRSA
ncbi:hypothetical protein KIP89_03745 [Ancylobacter sp. VKM B-3255]|uniref:Helix-turn-helix domain-containing protein n=2 Tax=Ancylobacter radicis TaxID=2836179 RepID=A0ABS5R3H5_9HYPH|nr:hypothetical protein [Ancylobacter radicis]